MAPIKAIMMGTLTAAAAGVGLTKAALNASYMGGDPSDERVAEQSAPTQSVLCLKTALPFFENGLVGCIEKEGLSVLAQSPLLDNQGRRVSMALVHPTDYMLPPQKVETCAQAEQLKEQGWYAASSREMRREQYFDRACGALRLLHKAQAYKEIHFQPAQLTRSDIGKVCQIISGKKAPSVTEIEKRFAKNAALSPGIWRMSIDHLQCDLQLIAEADFTDDKVGEAFMFATIGPEDGTAKQSVLGLLQKNHLDAELLFAPITHDAKSNADMP